MNELWRLSSMTALALTACNPLWGIDDLGGVAAVSVGGAGGTAGAGGMASAGGVTSSITAGGGGTGGSGGSGPGFCEQHPGAIFCAGFEQTDWQSTWQFIHPSTDRDPLAASGAYSSRGWLDEPVAACSYVGQYATLVTPGNDLEISFWMRPSGNPADFDAIPFRMNIGNTCQILMYHQNGVGDLRTNNNITLSFYVPPPVGAWSRVAIELHLSGGGSTISAKLDGLPNSDEANLPNACAPDSDILVAPELHCYSGPAVEIRYDDVLVEAL